MLDKNQPSVPRRDPWNKGRLTGQKRPLKPKDVWSIRVRLQVERQAWLADIRSRSTRYLFPSRVRTQPHLSTRQ